MKIRYFENGNKKLLDFGLKNPVGRKSKMGKENEYTKVEAEIYKFEKEGDMIEGELKSVDDSSSFGNKVYKIETKEGLRTVFGTTVIDSQMQLVPPNSMVKIVYTGEKENKKVGQNPIKLFDVFYKKKA